MEALLEENLILMHPFIMGEIALGSLRDWHSIMGYLGTIPFARSASDNEVLHMIDAKTLQGSGIGFIDAHLLASALLHAKAFIWTKDRRLGAVAERLGIDATTA